MDKQPDSEETLLERHNAISSCIDSLFLNPAEDDLRFVDIMINYKMNDDRLSGLKHSYNALSNSMDEACNFIDSTIYQQNIEPETASNHFATIAGAFGKWIDTISELATQNDIPFDVSEYALLTGATPSGALQSSDAAATGNNVVEFDSHQPSKGK